MNNLKIANSVTRTVLAETEYQKYFQKKLDDAGVGSPSELDDDKKKKFFEDVDKGWKSDKEKK